MAAPHDSARASIPLGWNVAPGSIIDFSTTPAAPPEGGTGVVNGVTYNATTQMLSFAGSTFSFAAAPLTDPPAATPNTEVDLTTPFTMTGTLVLTVVCDEPAFPRRHGA